MILKIICLVVVLGLQPEFAGLHEALGLNDFVKAIFVFVEKNFDSIFGDSLKETLETPLESLKPSKEPSKVQDSNSSSSMSWPLVLALTIPILVILLRSFW